MPFWLQNQTTSDPEPSKININSSNDFVDRFFVPLGPILGPILGPNLDHLGAKFGAKPLPKTAMLHERSSKNRLLPPNNRSQIHRFLPHPFYIDFGPILDPKMVPKWTQNRPQIHPKSITYTSLASTSTRDRFLIIFFIIYQTSEPLKSSKNRWFLLIFTHSAKCNFSSIRIPIFIQLDAFWAPKSNKT